MGKLITLLKVGLENHKINFNKIIRPDLAVYDRMDDHRNPENIYNILVKSKKGQRQYYLLMGKNYRG